MSGSSSNFTPTISNQLSSKSAWSRGPPQNPSDLPLPPYSRFQSHSRRPGSLAQGVPVEDGVSIPRNDVGVVKQGPAVTFGSMDDVSAPIFPQPSASPVVSEGAKNFGVLSTSFSSSSIVPAPGVTFAKPKMDLHKFFQNPSSQPSTPSTVNVNDTSSPAARPSPLPSQSSSNQLNPSSSTQPSLTPFVLNPRSQQQNTVPGSGPSPRSPTYLCQLTNGGGSHSQTGPSSGPSAGVSSPRLGAYSPSGMILPPPLIQTQVQSQVPVGWPGYHYPVVHGSGVPMSPRKHLPPMQGPGTPTIPHPAATPAYHPSPVFHAPSGSVSSTPSLLPNPSGALPGPGRLNTSSIVFAPTPSKKITMRYVDGREVSVETLVKGSSASSAPTTGARQNPSVTPRRKGGPVRIETLEQLRKRLDKQKAETEEREEECEKESQRREHEEGWGDAEENARGDNHEFLLQSRPIYEEKPGSHSPFDAVGSEQLSLTGDGSGQAFTNDTDPGEPSQSVGWSVISSGGSGLSPERSEAAGTGSIPIGGAALPFRGTSSQGGDMPSHRTRSKRGEKKSDATKATTGPQAYGVAFDQSQATPLANLGPIAPPQMSGNGWDRKLLPSNDPDAPEVVDRKLKALLNKLTMEKFDSISDQIIQWVNRSESQKDGRTLIQVIRFIFEKATDGPTRSEVYARLCRKMMEQISPKVQDEGIKNTEGKPIAGGQLFRRYLLNRCQEDFERGWVAKETTTAAKKAMEDQD
ncbi:hypothetical protein AX15_006011, partial [Amanita polypyramis BW_CC]